MSRSIFFVLICFSFLVPVINLNALSEGHPFSEEESSSVMRLTPQWFSVDNIKNFNLPANQIVLTFDDGPTSETLKILDILDQYKIKATFFIVGEKAKGPNPQRILSEIVRRGHLLGNHTYYHERVFPTEFSIEASLVLTDRLIRPHFNYHELYFFRVPYGYWEKWRQEALNKTNGRWDPFFEKFVGPIYWNVGGALEYSQGSIYGGADWDCWRQKVTPEACAQGYFLKTQRNRKNGMGSIVLMHDLYGNTTKMLDAYLKKVTLYNKKRGLNPPFRFINLNQVSVLKKYSNLSL